MLLQARAGGADRELPRLELDPGETRPLNHLIIPALDHDSWPEAQTGLDRLSDYIAIAKLNSLAEDDLSGSVDRLNRHYKLLAMVDRKVYDIDDTNRRRIRQQALAGGSILTVHAANTQAALKACVKGVDEAMGKNPSLQRPWLAGVTVLTSIGDDGFDRAGNPIETSKSIFGDERMKKVGQFIGFTADAGYEAVVCSAQEAELVKQNRNTEHLKTIVPAVRPEYSIGDDDEQRYTAVTPRIAIESGANFLVIGRPLIYAPRYGVAHHEAVQLITDDIALAA